jgi:hypothetical protein
MQRCIFFLKEQEGFLAPTEYIKRELKQSTSKTEHQGSKERKKGRQRRNLQLPKMHMSMIFRCQRDIGID